MIWKSTKKAEIDILQDAGRVGEKFHEEFRHQVINLHLDLLNLSDSEFRKRSTDADRRIVDTKDRWAISGSKEDYQLAVGAHLIKANLLEISRLRRELKDAGWVAPE